METVVLVIHVVATISLVVLVLVQQGKGANLGAAFGSGASNTVFGSVGSASFLTKLTAGIALVFFITSLTLAYIAHQNVKSGSSLDIPELISSPSDRALIEGKVSDSLENASGSEQISVEVKELGGDLPALGNDPASDQGDDLPVEKGIESQLPE